MVTTGRLYLDWNASAPLRGAVRAHLVERLSGAANASSVHAEGRAARAAIDAARRSVAALAGVSPRAVTFTSGASEANVTVLTPSWTYGGKPRRFSRLLVSAVEHPSVLKGGRFPAGTVEQIAVDGDGVVDIATLRRLLEAGAGAETLVSVQAANNETGVLQPLAAVEAETRAVGAVLHVDAVQAAGRLDLAGLAGDVLTLSAHKIGGLAGAGAILRRNELLAFDPLVTGGGQEGYARAGTEAVLAIEAFGFAAGAAAGEVAEMPRLSALRDGLARGIRAIDPSVTIFAEGRERLANTLAFASAGMTAETAVIAFDLAGIALSSGSACSSGKVAASHVLAAMGVDPALARCGIRVSFGPQTSEAELQRFVEVFGKVHADMTKGRATRAA